MSFVKLEQPRRHQPKLSGSALFALGFRPFFSLTGGFAALLVPLWLLILAGVLPAPVGYGVVGWHQHEMVFGLAGALLGGFLLTAVRNWTGIPTPTGAPLAALAGLWLAARLLPLVGIGGWPLAIVDGLYFPLLAAFLTRPLILAKQPQNQIFLLILLAIGVANGVVHAQQLGFVTGATPSATQAALGLVVLVMTIFGGRVIPTFTRAGLAQAQLAQFEPRRFAWVEAGAVPLVSVWVVALAVAPSAAPLLAGVLAVLHAVRLYGWQHRALWRVPLLWVLHLGYAWITLGFALQALAGLGWVMPSLATHAFTAGGIGVLGLGMMARVSLGHTGRMMQSARRTDLAFALVNAAVLLRVLGPLFIPGGYLAFLWLSGLCWTAAFALFCHVYWPMLYAPRVDGQPG